MKQTLSYNVHDILRFEMSWNRGYVPESLMNMKFAVFSMGEKAARPDITLNIGKFVPANSQCYVIDHKYHIKDNYFYCRDSGGRVSWEIEITGLERGATMVNLNMAPRLALNPIQLLHTLAFLPQAILSRIIDLRLGAKGYFLVHAAAVADKGLAYVLAGRAGCFKTTLCMDFVRRAGFTWLGDDRVILYRDKVLGFPLNQALFNYMTEHVADETRWNRLHEVRFVTEYSLGRSRKVSKPESAGLKAVLLLAKNSSLAGRKPVTFSPVPESQLMEVVDSFVTSRRLEDFAALSGFAINTAPFWRYLLTYSFVFPDSSIASKERELRESLVSTLKNVPIYRVGIPPDYSPDVFNGIKRFLGDLGN